MIQRSPIFLRAQSRWTQRLTHCFGSRIGWTEMSLPPFKRTLEEWPRISNEAVTDKGLAEQKTSCR